MPTQISQGSIFCFHEPSISQWLTHRQDFEFSSFWKSQEHTNFIASGSNLKMRREIKHLNKAGIEPRSTRSIWHQATAFSVNTQPRDPKDQQSLYQLSYSSSNKTRLLSFSGLYFFKGTRWNFFLSFFLIRWLDLISLILLRLGHQRFSQLLSTNSRLFLI